MIRLVAKLNFLSITWTWLTYGSLLELCLSPGVTGEVYCFPRRQLIFSFDRRVIYHLKGLREYIPKSILSVRLSVPRTSNKLPDFVFMLNVCFYTSMDLSQRALQTDGKLFSNSN